MTQKIIESDCGNVTTLAGDDVAEIVNVSEQAKIRISELLTNEIDGKFLRLAISGGGCSGFQYIFGFDDELDSTDMVNDWRSGKLVVDEVSIQYIKGSTVEFIKDLTGEYFSVVNPLAKSECGCGSSFSYGE